MKILTKKYDTKIVNNFEFDNFEFEVKIKLPTDFKNFIRNFQNCKVKEILFFDDKKELWVLNSFFSFAEIVDLYKEFLEEYHQKLIPFACDPGGWHFCLCMDEKDFGCIIVNRWTDYSEEEQFLKIADSFEEFINGLQVEETND